LLGTKLLTLHLTLLTRVVGSGPNRRTDDFSVRFRISEDFPRTDNPTFNP